MNIKKKKRVSLNSIQNKLALAIVICAFAGISEVKAQLMEVHPSWPDKIMIGRQDPINSASGNTALTFGRGVNVNENYGLWFMGSMENGFYIGRLPNCSLSTWGTWRAFYISPNGSIGINKWTPNPNSNNNCRLDVGGNMLVQSTWYNSDSRYKREIRPINSWTNLLKLNSIQYKPSGEALEVQLELFKKEYKNVMKEEEFQAAVSGFERQIADQNADTTTYFGYRAEELREVYPNLVSADHQGFLNVNYVGLIPVLVDAIKDLKAEINALKGGFEKQSTEVVSGAMLYQNTPNPFDKSTEIKCFVPNYVNNASICVYDLTGLQLLKIDVKEKGNASIFLTANQFKAGMYLYSLIIDGKEVDTKKMVITD